MYRTRGALLLIVLALAVPPLASGCSSRRFSIVERTGSFAATPAGRCAVVGANARPPSEPKCALIVWGSVDAPSPAERFAECLAAVARNEGGLSVMPPSAVERGLHEAGLDEGVPDADTEAQERAARSLGCDYYLTAKVHRWHTGYLLFLDWSVIDYTVACLRPGTPQEPIWTVRARYRARGMNQMDMAPAALVETFRWLRQGDAGADTATVAAP